MANRSKDTSKDSNKDHVEREIVIKASRERVFAALINPNAFPRWGPEKIEGKVEPGLPRSAAATCRWWCHC